ncbi:efflux RND transporter periplasmic adaptor subunit [Colwellia sp. C1TZA3]|uniref:efflux RND transporter periplasmic adaptor subunit n=1 Tax=Colwellia sp. C1TZA3 TaxID=2508879 RepID=UPI0011BA3C33|nr:efflux RND transporter periplasmic adaptor subunit [Colwellia sp. C1TZA3]TWX73899.1 HlyD family efflux transporter periplasmic adaptor subunit [Colwellia sp. C1TZA3]
MTTIFMKTKYTTLFLLMATALGSAVTSNNVIAGDNHDKTEQHIDNHVEEKSHGDEHGDEHGGEEGHVEITATNAMQAGIINATATSGQINQMTTVYGRTIINPNSISQVSARFPGLITKLTVNVGDFVKAGDSIVQVESSNSLKRYNITAPISGVITQRLANPGELANQQTLLTLENYDQLWVEYKIFPSQRQTIKTGQQVTISSSFDKTQSNITHLMANKDQSFITARVPLDNRDGLWTPGQLLTGSILTSQIDVSLLIDNRAFQEIEGKNVIFVTNKGGYETRELELGQSDGQFSQVLSGLEVGDEYALINSYLLKADLGKAGASHAH